MWREIISKLFYFAGRQQLQFYQILFQNKYFFCVAALFPI
jgi:hypothetical protein